MLATRQYLSWHFPSTRGPLLRARRERPRHRAAEQQDELAAFHCPICSRMDVQTSSAWPSSRSPTAERAASPWADLNCSEFEALAGPQSVSNQTRIAHKDLRAGLR